MPPPSRPSRETQPAGGSGVDLRMSAGYLFTLSPAHTDSKLAGPLIQHLHHLMIFTNSQQVCVCVCGTGDRPLTQVAVFAHVGGGAVALEVSVQVAAGTAVLAWLHGAVVHV